MSTSIQTDGLNIEIGRSCPVNGKATVSVKMVMEDEEREEMLDQIVSGESPATDRDSMLSALGLEPAEEE